MRPRSIADACAGGSDVSRGVRQRRRGGRPGDLGRSTSVATATYEYTIPAGAGEALDAGQPLEILPAELEAHVGDTIRIVNHDDRGHNVGPFFVGAGETMTQQFASPGDFVGICTVHPSGQFTLHVEA